MAENFDLIFGQNASQQYAWNDADYQNGWETIGNIPPTAAQFDALQRRTDTKAQELNSRLVNVEQSIAGGGSQKREPDTEYTVGTILTYDDLPMDWVLECIVGGISSANDITIPSPRVEGARILDGTVTWALRKIATYGGVGYRQSSTSYYTGAIAFSTALPTGWYLECTGTGGTTSASDLVITSPSVGDTVTDGTVTWTIRKIGSGGDGVPLGAIIAYSANGELPSGYLLCDGSAVSRTMFPDLFACIGTKYGAGDGSTTFNLPGYSFIGDTEANVFGNGKALAFTDNSILFGPRTSSSSGVSYATTAYGQNVGSALSSGSGLTSGKVTGIATKSLLGNTPENSGLTAELATDSNTIYLIKAFNGQTEDSALIDITQYAQELATKADRDLDNLSAAGEAKIQSVSPRYLTDSYYNSTTGDWYRVYSDGWVEQGGYLANTSDNQQRTITLLKPFNNTYYTILTQRCYPGTASNSNCVDKVNMTTTSFKLYLAQTSTIWYACGIGAQS